jgi:hypothetical protein
MVQRVALYGPNIQIAAGVYPAFADCPVDIQAYPALLNYINRRWGLGMEEVQGTGSLEKVPSLVHAVLFAFTNSATTPRPASAVRVAIGLRSWFDQGGVYIGRPAANEPSGLAVALTGGHNAEEHNHNDVGSYMVALGGTSA